MSMFKISDRILKALADGRELSGAQLSKETKTGWLLYVVLAVMEESKMIESRFELGESPRRRLYKIK